MNHENRNKSCLHGVFIVVQLLSHVQLFSTPWTAACQASLSITTSCSLQKLMSIESMMPSDHLILCHPLLLLPTIFSSVRVFSNELALCIMWPKYWSFSFSISPSNEYSGLMSFRIEWFDLLAVQDMLKKKFFLLLSSPETGERQTSDHSIIKPDGSNQRVTEKRAYWGYSREGFFSTGS